MSAVFPKTLISVAKIENETEDELLAHLGPNAAATWTLLETTPEIAQMGQRSLEAVPTVKQVESALRPPLAWQSSRSKLLEGQDLAEQVLDREEVCFP